MWRDISCWSAGIPSNMLSDTFSASNDTYSDRCFKFILANVSSDVIISWHLFWHNLRQLLSRVSLQFLWHLSWHLSWHICISWHTFWHVLGHIFCTFGQVLWCRHLLQQFLWQIFWTVFGHLYILIIFWPTFCLLWKERRGEERRVEERRGADTGAGRKSRDPHLTVVNHVRQQKCIFKQYN